MNRLDWLAQKRLASERMLDRQAAVYDESWGAMDATHRLFVENFLSLCPPKSRVLDAACGTGKYWPMILASGRTVFGIDRSQGMLDRARQKFPDIPTERVAMQDLRHRREFNGAICMDAMESLSPEDWPLVLRKLSDAIRPNCHLYFTVETADEQSIEDAYRDGQSRGLPIVPGEWAPEGRYHYYPKMEQVRAWLATAGFSVLEEAQGSSADDPYHHFLTQGTPRARET